jgi:lipoic acid synthetase
MCPNIGECWGAGTATIMILGDTCTRGCHFCNVKTGSPRGEVDWLEPKRVAEAVRDLGWNYLVLTAVDRDDLADGGAAIFASTVRMIHKLSPGAKVECLTGDFAGDLAALDVVLDAEPEVLAHNLETVRRLQISVRDRRANFIQSLSILEHAKKSPPNATSTSSSTSRPRNSSACEKSANRRASARSSAARSRAARITRNRLSPSGFGSDTRLRNQLRLDAGNSESPCK